MLFKCFLVVLTASILGGSCVLRKIPAVNSQLDQIDQAREREVVERIKKSEDFKQVAQICAEVGESSNLTFVRRSLPKGDSIEIYYDFISDQSIATVSKTLSDYFKNSGWNLSETSAARELERYRKNEFRVEIQYRGMGDLIGFTCMKRPSN